MAHLAEEEESGTWRVHTGEYTGRQATVSRDLEEEGDEHEFPSQNIIKTRYD